MYKLILDSDSLIKLTHAEMLNKICETFECITTTEVKRETVDEGKKRFYPDADIIEDLIKNQLIHIKDTKRLIGAKPNLGLGEISVFSLSIELKNSLIVSDDQTFIKELEKQNINFLVPSDLIILLKRRNKINLAEAKYYLEKLKTFIRDDNYNKIKKELEEK